jgi:hypothetical protein
MYHICKAGIRAYFHQVSLELWKSLFKEVEALFWGKGITGIILRGNSFIEIKFTCHHLNKVYYTMDFSILIELSIHHHKQFYHPEKSPLSLI